MLNLIWLILLLTGVGMAATQGRAQAVTQAAADAARQAVDTALALAGLMALWLGLMKIAERSGLMSTLARGLRPLVQRLFPDLPRDHPAVGAIVLNISANLLGLGSAATPMGLKAIQGLQEAQRGDPRTASPAMCTFLALNTSSFTLIPGAVIALRAAAGSAQPAEIVVPTLLASLVAAAVGLSADWLCRRLWPRGDG